MGPDDQGLNIDELMADCPKPKDKPPPMPWEASGKDAAVWGILDRWPDKYYRDGSLRQEGDPRPTTTNIVRVLETDPRWNGGAEKAIRLDEFRDVLSVNGRPHRSADNVDISVWLDTVYGLRATPDMVRKVIGSVGDRVKFHPVRDYLNGLQWDGKKRLHRLFTHYVGGVDLALARELGPRWAISAVARIMRPGCKVDTSVVFMGSQGARKSSFMEAMAVNKAWFSSTPFIFGTKDSYQQLDGVWLYELAELASLRPSGVEAVKAFLSQSVDRYRRSYGEKVAEVYRQTVFVGSTNEQEFLHDATGARRFWPVRVGKILLEEVVADRDHLWAEAVELFKSGERWWLTEAWNRELEVDQQQHRDVDPWEAPIDAMLGGAAYQGGVTVNQVLSLALSIPVERQTRGIAMRAARIVQGLGWTRRRAMVKGTRENRWFPPKD